MATPTSPGYAALISSHHQLSGIAPRSIHIPDRSARAFAGFSLRGLEKVEGEWTLVALAYNCKRLHKLSLAV